MHRLQLQPNYLRRLRRPPGRPNDVQIPALRVLRPSPDTQLKVARSSQSRKADAVGEDAGPGGGGRQESSQGGSNAQGAWQEAQLGLQAPPRRKVLFAGCLPSMFHQGVGDAGVGAVVTTTLACREVLGPGGHVSGNCGLARLAGAPSPACLPASPIRTSSSESGSG